MAELRLLLAIAAVFAPLSLLSIGGGPSIFAEMQRQAVDVHGWMTARDFVDLFAVSRAAPGPGSLIAALIGWRAAGIAGAAAAALALYVPSSLLMYAAGLWWHGNRHARLRAAIERGLRPVAVGLIFAGALRVLQADGAGWPQLLTAGAACAAILLRWSPYLVLGAAGLAFGTAYALGQGGAPLHG